MTRERGDVLVDDFAYVVWHFEPLASDEVTVTCEPGRSLNEWINLVVRSVAADTAM